MTDTKIITALVIPCECENQCGRSLTLTRDGWIYIDDSEGGVHGAKLPEWFIEAVRNAAPKAEEK